MDCKIEKFRRIVLFFGSLEDPWHPGQDSNLHVSISFLLIRSQAAYRDKRLSANTSFFNEFVLNDLNISHGLK